MFNRHIMLVAVMLINPYNTRYFPSTQTEYMSNHSPNIDLCLLDLSAAFHTLDHSILFHNFSSWSSLSTLQWFTSYLSSRTSAVSISPLSLSSPLTCGVPQGSVLGPILFNLYTTSLSSLISYSTVSHLLYANDTSLFISLIHKNFL